MRYGVIVHGPEAIDSGLAAETIADLESSGAVSATLGGAMGLAALIDARLEERITVVPRQLVSDALTDMDGRSDALVLLNMSKSRGSGLAFGRMVVGRTADQLQHPLVQLDNGFYVVWRDGIPEALQSIIKRRGLERLEPPDLPAASRERRSVSGVLPGENIWINGTVVGRATSSEVEVHLHDGVVRFKGVEVKPHGMEKLRLPDLGRAIIRSGSVRRTPASARTKRNRRTDRVVLVDHRAEDSIFRAEGAKAAVTVGDDTTRIAASLLARLGVPVIGIVDGDEDGICLDSSAAEGSMTLKLYPGNDDQLGAVIRKSLFNGREEMNYLGSLEELTSTIIALADGKVMEILKKGRRSR